MAINSVLTSAFDTRLINFAGRELQSIMSITEYFGKTVRKRRKELKMSQEDLAHVAGINQSHIGQIERGLKSASLTTIGRIAKALNCSPALLLDCPAPD